MVSLMIKRHIDTDLKYLCKTVREPYSYKGSGTRWKNHLRKHGCNIETLVIFEGTLEEVKNVALDISYQLNVVNSSEWANLTHENGVDGLGGGHVAWNKGLSMGEDFKSKCRTKKKTPVSKQRKIHQRNLVKAGHPVNSAASINKRAMTKKLNYANGRRISAYNRSGDIVYESLCPLEVPDCYNYKSVRRVLDGQRKYYKDLCWTWINQT